MGQEWGARLRASAVIAIGLLLALAATAGPLPHPAGAPGASLIVRLPDAVQVTVLVLLALSAILLLALQRPRRPAEDEPLPIRVAQRRPAWVAALMTLPVLILLTAVGYLIWTRWSGGDAHPIERAISAIAELLDALARARKPPTSVPLFDLTIATLVLLLALAIFALIVLVAFADRLEKWWDGRAVAEAAPVVDDFADHLDDPRAEADPRVAIIRAYGRFERAAAAARAPRAPWQTPTEFLRTTLALLPVPAPPVTRLTALFELARFSDRPLGAPARDTACDCLDEITTALEAQPHPSETAHPRFKPGKRSDTEQLPRPSETAHPRFDAAGRSDTEDHAR